MSRRKTISNASYVRGRLVLPTLLACSACINILLNQSLADIPEPAFRDLEKQSRELVHRESEAQKVSSGRLLKVLVMSYELTSAAKAVTDTLADDTAFQQWLEQKGINWKDPTKEDGVRIENEMGPYLRSTSKFTPEMMAWWNLLEGQRAPWTKMIPDYRTIQTKRPDDLPPKLVMMMSVPSDNPEEWNDWLNLVKDAYRPAKAALADFGKWLSTLDKSPEFPEFSKKITYCQLTIALAEGRYADAAEYGKDSPLRVWTPVWLMSEHKLKSAQDLLAELKQLPDLSERERETLTVIEGTLRAVSK